MGLSSSITMLSRGRGRNFDKSYIDVQNKKEGEGGGIKNDTKILCEKIDVP